MGEFRQYCRACKSYDSETFIDMECEHLGMTYKSLFVECTGIQIVNDEISKFLCETCIRALIFSHEFTQMCKKTQKEIESTMSLSMFKTEETEILEKMVKPFNDDMNTKGTDDKKDIFEMNIVQNERKEEEKKYFCDICDETLASVTVLETHMIEIHQENQCKTCKKVCNGSTSLDLHTKSCHKSLHRSFNCSICQKTFSTISVLNRHTRTVHENLRKHLCPHCNKSFKHKNHLEAHLSLHLVKKRTFICDICSLSFKTEPVLANHLKLHTAIPSHVCDICGKKFKSHSYLKTHKGTHSTTRPFKCNLCQKAFKTSKTLKDHEIVHKISDLLDCHVCGKKFKNKITLSHHLKDHFTPGVSCLACGKVFRNKYVLKDHITTQHENIRKYKCQVDGCDHAYFTSSHLNYHVKEVHLGINIRKNNKS